MSRVRTSLVIGSLLCGWGTAPAQQPGFEVATIKPSGPLPSVEVRNAYRQQQGPILFDWQRSPLFGLIRLAYQLDAPQVVTPDEWMRLDLFDVVAKAPRESTQAEGLTMLRALLAERFALRFHWEMRELPVYEITIARRGLKMKAAAPREGVPVLTRPTRSEDAVTVGTGRGASIPEIIFMLSRSLRGLRTERLVIDQTGLQGTYDFDIAYLDPAAEAQPQGRRLGDAPGIFTAVEESLGLRIEATNRPVEVLIVDSAQRSPMEN